MNLFYSLKSGVEAILHPSLMLNTPKESDAPGIVLVMAPDYLNYGDHAIALAERDFFRDTFPGTPVKELPLGFIPHWPKRCRKQIRPNDTIVITGGGFLGSMWMKHHEMAESFLRDFPDNRIIFAPNTVYWDKGHESQAQAFADLLNAYRNVHLCVREENSYEVMRSYGCETLLMPDFVLLWQRKSLETASDGSVALCLRSDREGIISAEQVASICTEKASDRKIRRITMAVDHVEIPSSIRPLMVEKKLKEFATAELVITDRLHGMVYAAICGTPCIALDNASHKVSGVYRWIQDLDHVVLAQYPQELPELIDRMGNINRSRALQQLNALKETYAKQYLPAFEKLFY